MAKPAKSLSENLTGYAWFVKLAKSLVLIILEIIIQYRQFNHQLVWIMEGILEFFKKYLGINLLTDTLARIGESSYGYYIRRLLPVWYITVILKVIETGIVYTMLFSSLEHNGLMILKLITLIFTTSAISFLLLSLLMLVYLFCMPLSVQYSRFDKICSMILIYIILYALNFARLGAELFWQELANFFGFYGAAITAFTADHLHSFYVLHPLISCLMFAIFIALLWLFNHFEYFWPDVDAPEFSGKIIGAGIQIALVAVVFAGLYFSGIVTHVGLYANELVKNSTSTLFYDLLYNRKFERVYASADIDTNLAILQGQRSNRQIISYPDKTSLMKQVRYTDPERRLNVMLVLMHHIDTANIEDKTTNNFALTPALGWLAARGIYFRNVYTTGTTGVHGMDAVLISSPVATNKAIIEHKHNQGVFNAANVFNAKGYQSKFIYGGYSYLNNMGNFFRENGYTVIDRYNFTEPEVSFETTKGVSDGDLFNKVLFEADKSYLAGKRFFNVVLTSSNQHPYLLPAMAVKFPIGTSKEEKAIRYADLAISEFMGKAAKKPWFNNTIFVFVSDTTSMGPKQAGIDVADYRIPLIFYAPRHIQPMRYRTELSQIDVLPTLLGLLRFDYNSTFYGMDALQPTYVSRYFINNDYTLRYIKDEIETIMKPGKIIFNYSDTKKNITNNNYKAEAIAFFQTSYYWQKYLRSEAEK